MPRCLMCNRLASFFSPKTIIFSCDFIKEQTSFIFQSMFIPCWLGGPLLCNKQTKIKSSQTQPHIVEQCTCMYVQDTKDSTSRSIDASVLWSIPSNHPGCWRGCYLWDCQLAPILILFNQQTLKPPLDQMSPEHVELNQLVWRFLKCSMILPLEFICN